MKNENKNKHFKNRGQEQQTDGQQLTYQAIKPLAWQ
jgi:hypothetical protein